MDGSCGVGGVGGTVFVSASSTDGKGSVSAMAWGKNMGCEAGRTARTWSQVKGTGPSPKHDHATRAPNR